MKTSIVEIKTHTHASMHACTCTHTQEELNNRVEGISRKLGERYKDITQKLSRDTRGIIFHIWEIKRHGRLSEEVSHAPIFWVPEERRERMGEAGFEETMAKNFQKLIKMWTLRFRKCKKYQTSYIKINLHLDTSYNATEYQEQSGVLNATAEKHIFSTKG